MIIMIVMITIICYQYILTASICYLVKYIGMVRGVVSAWCGRVWFACVRACLLACVLDMITCLFVCLIA